MGLAFSFIQDQGVAAGYQPWGTAATSHLGGDESPFPSAALRDFLKLGGPAEATSLSSSSVHFSPLQVEAWVSTLSPQRGVASKLPRREVLDHTDHPGPLTQGLGSLPSQERRS